MNALATIHVAKKQLGLDDDTYRALLKRVTGKTSAGVMSDSERVRVVEALRQRGFNPAKRGLEGPFARKIVALWIAAWNLGVVPDRADAALAGFVRRQTDIDHTRWLVEAAQADKVIQALKARMARDAGVDWHVGPDTPGWARNPKAKVAVAQWRIVHPSTGSGGIDFAAFKAFVEGHAFNPLPRIKPREWDGITKRLGVEVRRVKALGNAAAVHRAARG
ncbi:gp16 family protein [Chelativorans alearense]|uniref:gp16 family protein n=1 Tax=Chelativorans alearense TaxID=2681495 RepID=UPI0013D30652|nr:regulatory protein GemA [Chelativorans alearense]